MDGARAVVATLDVLYKFDRFKTKVEEHPRELRKLTLSVSRRSDLAEGETGLARGLAVAGGMKLCRDLGNLPSNVCTPRYVAQTAEELATEYGVAAEILDEAAIHALGMRTFLSVAKGSIEPPRLIVLKYQGASATVQPVVLVGKGITFDSGGISLKPGEGMDEMKYDMLGAATVLGTFRAAVEMQLPLNLIAVVATCENMPSGGASKPGELLNRCRGKPLKFSTPMPKAA